MSIIAGLVDTHHEMELTPSTRLVRSNWFARHLWAIFLVGVAVALYFAL
jgi:hypothetical protein